MAKQGFLNGVAVGFDPSTAEDAATILIN